jgi:hypothetical protein
LSAALAAAAGGVVVSVTDRLPGCVADVVDVDDLLNYWY